MPFMHCTPGAQSPFDVHAPKQSFLLASHEKGTQTFAGPALQVPAPSHTLTSTTAAPSHIPGAQTAPLTYLRHAP